MAGLRPGLWGVWRGCVPIWMGNWWRWGEWGQERRMSGVSVVALGLEWLVALTMLGGGDGREVRVICELAEYPQDSHVSS